MQGSMSAPIESLAFSADGEMVASTAADGSVAVWDVHAATLRETFTGTTPAVDPAFSPNGETLYAGSADGSVLAWDVRGDRRLVSPFRVAPVGGARQGATSTAVAVSPDGSTFATSPAPGRISLWRSRDETRVGELTGPAGFVKSVAFSHDGRLLAAAGRSPNIVVWNVRQRKLVNVLRQPVPLFPRNEEFASAVAFAPDNKLVAAAANDGLQVFALPSGRLLHSEPVGGTTSDLSFSADGRLLAVAGQAGIDVWEVRRWKQVLRINDGTPVISLRFEPHGTTMAGGDSLGNITFWDAVTARPPLGSLGGQDSPVSSLSFDPAGDRLMTTSADGKIRLWDLTTQKLIGNPLVASDTGGRGTFFPNGKRLIAVFGSGAGVVWDVDPASWRARACRIARRNFSPTEWQSFLPNLAYRKVCP
jgi:WD40 repeat protein